MVTEVRPLGIRCNLECLYCYQNALRDATARAPSYDLDRIKRTIERVGGPFTLFGGEALLLPEPDLEDLWAWGHEKYGSNGVQSNGTLINETHIRLFKQYNVHVGISMDGPGALNDVRWAGTLKRTRAATSKTMRAVERLGEEGVARSLIVTLHRGNATADRFPVLLDWFRYLDSIGVLSARLHLLEVESAEIQAAYALSVQENIDALIALADLESSLPRLRFDIFTDMRRVLTGEDNCVTCLWAACDPYTTHSVWGVEGNAQATNCGRENKDGVDFSKAEVEGFERYLALYHTPQEYGGCQDCRFFLMCKGNCPGTALDGDWRNRSQDCPIWFHLLSHVEASILAAGSTPLSLHTQRDEIEAMFLDAWASGRNTSLAQCLVRLAQGAAREPTALPAGLRRPHGDRPHEDSPHGDHTDAARREVRIPREPTIAAT